MCFREYAKSVNRGARRSAKAGGTLVLRGTMSAYYFVDVLEIKDPVIMGDYRTRINGVVERFGGRYVVIGGPFQVLEGSYQPVFPVMIEP